MSKAYRITLDYKVYDFTRLKKEYDDDKTATWYIKNKQGNPKIKSDFEFYSKKEEQEYMDAYIYCSNMPDRLNRFVFKGKIIDVSENTNSDFKDYDYKIVIGDIYVFNEEDAPKLAFRNSVETPFSPQGTYGELNEKVKKYLEKFIINEKNTLEVFLNAFTGCQCELHEFNDVILNHSSVNHSSFIKNNNEVYVEFHHLIFREFGYDDKELLKELDTVTKNYAQLCPNCHRAIHYGKKDLRKRMLDELLENRKKELDALYKKWKNNKTFVKKMKKYKSCSSDDLIDFLYKIYQIED